MVDPNSKLKIIQEIPIWKECASSENKCQSELINPFGGVHPKYINFTSKHLRKHRDPTDVAVKIMLTVIKDPSYGTKLYMKYPPGARFWKISDLGNRENRLVFSTFLTRGKLRKRIVLNDSHFEAGRSNSRTVVSICKGSTL